MSRPRPCDGPNWDAGAALAGRAAAAGLPCDAVGAVGSWWELMQGAVVGGEELDRGVGLGCDRVALDFGQLGLLGLGAGPGSPLLGLDAGNLAAEAVEDPPACSTGRHKEGKS